MATYKLTLEYDGTDFAGWQRQADQPTVQGVLEQALSTLTQQPTPVVGAGRTDAGVHALGQVASFRSEKPLAPHEWMRGLNALMPDRICVRSVDAVSDDFHARYSAKGKLYAYLLLNRPGRTALDRDRVWHVPRPLDRRAMREAAALLIGTHDCSSFKGAQSDTENPVCTIRQLSLEADGERLRIEVYADRFLKQMVRAMVGTLVEVGLGRRPPTAMTMALAARDRTAAGRTAPPHGLYLVRVDYDAPESTRIPTHD